MVNCVAFPVCACLSPVLTESLGSLQGLRSCVSHIETLDGHATILHQLLALVLLQIQPSPGTQPGALEGRKRQRETWNKSGGLARQLALRYMKSYPFHHMSHNSFLILLSLKDGALLMHRLAINNIKNIFKPPQKPLWMALHHRS